MAKRILVITNHYYPENFKVNDLVEHLIEKNYVHVVTGKTNYTHGKIYKCYHFFKKTFEIVNSKLSVVRLPLVPRGSGSKFRLIINYFTYFISLLLYSFYLLTFQKYDVIIIHHTSPPFLIVPALIIKLFKKTKIVYWELDFWPDSISAVGIKLNSFLKFNWIFDDESLSKFWCYFNWFKFIFSKCIDRFVIEDKIHYFPNWAEKWFTVKNSNKSPIPDFPNGFNILYAGNIGKAQNFDPLIEVINEFKDTSLNWIFVGDGREKDNFKRKINDDLLEKKIFFLGSFSVDLMPHFYEKADILYLSLNNSPIFSKTVPAKLQSYMAYGKPVLAMISGEGNSIIKKSSCGFVVNAYDIKGLKKTLLKILNTNKKALDVMGKNGKSYYDKYFSFEMRKIQIDNILNKILK